ncbi:hypothetical protein J2W96_001836 [Variovorax guangxiensis]|nr:hypothetical protein [Variovorax guangxiensis]
MPDSALWRLRAVRVLRTTTLAWGLRRFLFAI